MAPSPLHAAGALPYNGLSQEDDMTLKQILKKTACSVLVFAATAGWPVAALANERSEIANAATHAGLAAQATDLIGVHTHLHHTLNCLVGPKGMGFDAKEINPCANAGDGAIPDAADATHKMALEDAANTARAGVVATDFAAAKKDATDTHAALNAMK
jgi:hypothetical protein